MNPQNYNSPLHILLRENLVFYMSPFQECTKQQAGNAITQINDWSPNANHLDVISVAAPGAFFGSNFFTFNGASDYLQRNAGDCTGLDPLLTSFSVGAWVKTSSAAMIRIANKHAGAGYWWLRKQGAGVDRMQFFCRDGVANFDVISGVGYDDGLWHLVIGIIDRGTNELRLNVDNSELPTTNIAGMLTINSAGGNFIVGKYTTANDFWDGEISDLFVYNKALTVAEIDLIYKNSFPKRIGI